MGWKKREEEEVERGAPEKKRKKKENDRAREREGERKKSMMASSHRWREASHRLSTPRFNKRRANPTRCREGTERGAVARSRTRGCEREKESKCRPSIIDRRRRSLSLCSLAHSSPRSSPRIQSTYPSRRAWCTASPAGSSPWRRS